MKNAKKIQKTLYSVITEADDGSGDAILTFPDELIEEMGWKEGTKLNLKVVEQVGGPVLVITEKDK